MKSNNTTEAEEDLKICRCGAGAKLMVYYMAPKHNHSGFRAINTPVYRQKQNHLKSNDSPKHDISIVSCRVTADQDPHAPIAA
jgi:hypothetical protein